MRIEKGKNEYIEMVLSSPGKVAIIIAAKEKDNPLKSIINTSEVSIDELASMIKALGVQVL